MVFNPNSNQQLSTLLFGGEVLTTEQEPILDHDGNYLKWLSGLKEGQVRTRNIKVKKKISGLGLDPNKFTVKQPKSEYFKVDNAVIKKIQASDLLTKEGKQVVDLLLEYTKYNKELATYYRGWKKLIHDHDSCIHGHFNHTASDTGRLTSKKPNQQNAPRSKTSEFRKCFISRYGEAGKIISMDFSQLEVVVFAFMCQDKNLIKDITEGVDIHRRLAAKVYKVPEDAITNQQRQIIKGGTFAIIYGAGEVKIGKTLGISSLTARKIKKLFFQRYPEAERWQNRILEQVDRTKMKINEFTKKGLQKQQGYYITPTKRLLIFKTNDTPEYQLERGIKTSFNPPDIKDYPIQSLATADIVLIFLGKLFRKMLYQRDKCLLINTVHDSIDIDCKKEYVEETCNLLQNEVHLIPKWLKEDFGIDFNLPIECKVSVGDSWWDCK